MIIPSMFFDCIQFLVLLTFLTVRSARAELTSSETSTNQLFNILGSLQPFRSQLCQFKFENCVQDSSYADLLDNECNIYSRLRDCFRSLLDEKQCLTSQLKRQYRKAKQNEYEACGIALSFESIHSSTPQTSNSSKQTFNQHFLAIFIIFLII